MRNLLQDDLGRLRKDINLEVHASSSGVPVSNATVQEVCELNPELTILTLRNCDLVTDAGLWYAAYGSRASVSRYADDRWLLVPWCAFGRAIARACTSITSLNLSGLPEVSHVGIRAVTLRCRDLEVLDLSRCAGVHDLACRVLAAGCWALKDLNLHGTKAITDAGISELVQCCKRLERLNVSQYVA